MQWGLWSLLESYISLPLELRFEYITGHWIVQGYLDRPHGLCYKWNFRHHQITTPNDCLADGVSSSLDYFTDELLQERIPLNYIYMDIYDIYIYIYVRLHLESDIYGYFLDIAFENILRVDTYWLYLISTDEYRVLIVCAIDIVLCNLVIYVLLVDQKIIKYIYLVSVE